MFLKILLFLIAFLVGADELMLVSDVYDPALRLRSLDIAAQAHASLGPAAVAA